MESSGASRGVYWYNPALRDETGAAGDPADGAPVVEVDSARGRRVLESMRQYQAAEKAMRRRTQESMAMGENELLVLRYLLRAKGQDRTVSPTDLARYLGISTPSITALLDRLEKTGYVTRSPHPSDRRRLLVTTTDLADGEVRETLGDMHGRMMEATRGMSEGDTAAIIEFLDRMQAAVDGVSTEEPFATTA